jgi:hypothetical protein
METFHTVLHINSKKIIFEPVITDGHIGCIADLHTGHFVNIRHAGVYQLKSFNRHIDD